MGESSSYIDQFLLNPATKKSSAAKKLLGGSTQQIDDSLLSAAAKRQSDKIQLTQVMLKTQLVQRLDKTIADQLEKHDLQGQVFIAINTHEHTAEVLPLEEVLKSEEITDPAAADAIRRNPVRYHAGDAELTTPDESKYQEFKRAIDRFFENNADEFEFLRTSTTANKSMDDFYNAV